MLLIAQDGYQLIKTHAELAYPNECCGVLLGKADGEHRVVYEVVRCSNTKGQAARTRYNIDPREIISAQKEGRTRGLDIIGFYHSHPDAPAHFSRNDLEQAFWLAHSYVIASVLGGAAAEVRSYVLEGTEDDRNFIEEVIRLHDNPAHLVH